MAKGRTRPKDRLFRMMKSKNTFPIIIIIFIVMNILFINSWGFDREELPGKESNYNIRIAEQINESGWDLSIFSDSSVDRYSHRNTDMNINLGNLILSFFLALPNGILWILNISFAAMMLILIFFLLRINGMQRFESNMALILMISSPVMVYFSIIISPILLYSMIGTIIMICMKKGWTLGAILMSLLIPFFGITHTIIFIILAFLYAKSIDKTRIFYRCLIAMIALGAIIQYMGMSFSFFRVPFFNIYDILEEIISEFGGFRGMGMMTIVLGLVGFGRSFVERRYQLLQLGLIVLIFTMVFFDYRIVFILNLIFAVYGAYGLAILVRRRWYSEDLRKLTMLIVICGLLFTILSYAPRFDEIEPSREKANALRWMSDNLEKDVVLSEPSFSPYIQNIAEKTTIINHFDMDTETRQDILEMFRSRDLEKTEDLFREYDIDYVYIDCDIESSTWLHENDGLLFLLRDRGKFRKLFEGDGAVRIYEFIG